MNLANAGGVFDSPEDTQQTNQQEEQSQTPPDPSVEVAHLDEETEGLLARAERTLGEPTTFSIHQRVYEGKELGPHEIGQWASQHGVEPAQMSQAITRVTGQLRDQARRVVGLDAETFDHFEAWAKENFPEETRQASLAQFHKANVKGIKSLAQEFITSGAQWHPDDILEAQLADGVETFRNEQGQVMIRAHGLAMTARDAIRNGAVRVSRVR